ncbi:hypothetical protein EB796_019609 [Bugula neritina]|uniref:lysozyme n=1 Tax=Bugula neritina TaxID=10212 RepID=A0A7J7J930_BUGNE|nr:hypothetical protein EB796_019609 [Bugula neritina]
MHLSVVVLVCLSLAFVTQTQGNISSSCLDCIGEIEGGGSGCNRDVGSLSCGRYQIKEPYYTDCRQPGSGWRSCAADDTCSRTCVQNYMSRYARRCARQLGKPKSQLTCQDYGRLHNGGPNGCRKSSTISYAARISSQCGLN